MFGRLLVVSTLIACGSHPTEVTPPRPTGRGNLPDGAPLVSPGERMSYKLALQGMELATYDLGVGDLADVGGRKTIVVQSHAKAVGLVKMVANIDDYFTSYIDVETGRPLRWQTDEYATKSTDKERTDARLFERNGDHVPIDFHLNNDPPKAEPQKVSLPEVWDYNAFLVALRSWEGPPGTTTTAEVLRSRFLWHVDVKIHGRDKLVTDLGEFSALRIDGHTYKLGRDGKKLAGEDERDFSVWISDDAGRAPLQTTARTDYGDIVMKIVDYQPGNGEPIRKAK